MTDQRDQQDLRDLLERERLVALVDHYVNTLDQPSPFDEDWARSLFTENVRLEHEIAVLEGIEEVAAAHRMVMARWERTFHFSANHRIEFDGRHAHLTARLMAIHVHPGEHPPDPLIAANVLEADAVQTRDGWRFDRFAPRTLWRTGQSPAPIDGDEQYHPSGTSPR
jgi:SnoaL-like domain